MMLCLLFWCLTAPENVAKFKEAVTLSPVPSDSAQFLEQPLSFDFDGQGNYYLLDGGAKLIFVWDSHGAFKGTIGKAGPGPGELVLEGRGGSSSGYLNILGKTLYVMDPGKREIMLFNLDGSFQRAIPLRMARGRIFNFSVLNESQFLVHRRVANDDKTVSEIIYLDGEGNTTKTIASEPDDSFQRRGDGANATFKVKAFHTSMVSDYNCATGQLLIGRNVDPSFELYAKDLSKKVIKVNMIREDVTKADKDDYMKRYEGARRVPQVEYPDKKAFYTHLLSLGDNGFLVYNQSEYSRELKGLHMDKTGAFKGRFTMTCGPAGGLLASKGRVLAVTLDEDADFQINELKFQ